MYIHVADGRKNNVIIQRSIAQYSREEVNNSLVHWGFQYVSPYCARTLDPSGNKRPGIGCSGRRLDLTPCHQQSSVSAYHIQLHMQMQYSLKYNQPPLHALLADPDPGFLNAVSSKAHVYYGYSTAWGIRVQWQYIHPISNPIPDQSCIP